MINRSQIIQPALLNDSFEFFNVGPIRHQLTRGISKIVNNLPGNYLHLLEEKLKVDSSAQRGLDKLGIFNISDRLHKYHDCNYSAYDHAPDITVDGSLGPCEWVACGKRDNCPAQGDLCKYPNGLSKRQIQISQRIGLRQMDEQIAAELGITTHTVRKHKNVIEESIGYGGKVAIALWAVEMKLI